MKKKKSKKTLYIILAIIIVLIIVGLVKGKSSDVSKVTTGTATLRSITEMVTANGKIQPETDVAISSGVSGEIIELPVKEGDKVKKDDLLIRINPDLVQAALDRSEASLNNMRASEATAKARLAQSQAQFTNAELTFNRNQILLEQGAISQAEFDELEAGFLSAQADVEAAKQTLRAAEFSVQSAIATVKEARDTYTRTTIYSPMDGTISKLNVEVGEQVVGTAQMAGTEIMRVANLKIMEVVVDVNESDIVKVSFNDTCEIEVDAYLDRKFKGIVTEIANSATTGEGGIQTDQVTNFEVKVRILESSYADLINDDNRELSPFRPGMNATVDIRTSTVNNALSVPIEAVTSRADTSSGGAKSKVSQVMKSAPAAEGDDKPIECVFLLRDGKAVIQGVTTGLQDDMHIQIVSGLEEGDRIITGPYDVVSQKLFDGQQVESVEKDQLYQEKD